MTISTYIVGNSSTFLTGAVVSVRFSVCFVVFCVVVGTATAAFALGTLLLLSTVFSAFNSEAVMFSFWASNGWLVSTDSIVTKLNTRAVCSRVDR
jgi:hypothetical protein